MTMVHFDVVVVGAGLSGLATAHLLTEAGLSVCVIEARDRIGGRIHSVTDPQSGDYVADLGPTWVWPAFQPVVSQWLDRLDVATFEQYVKGQAILDGGPDGAPQQLRLPDQDGLQRIKGGPQALINALWSRLPPDATMLGTVVSSVQCTKDDTVHIRCTDGTSLHCGSVVLATPPRIAAPLIRDIADLTPGLPSALERMPTWMAPHAKLVATYDTAFWRPRGLSGRIASRDGPIVEAHDHCSEDGTTAALFGFLGWPAHMRTELGPTVLETQVREQLTRCFGADSPAPTNIFIEDWAQQPCTTAPSDLSGPSMHPDVGPEILRQRHLNGRLVLAGAEVAARSPGLIEGAFVAAEHAATLLVKDRAHGSQTIRSTGT